MWVCTQGIPPAYTTPGWNPRYKHMYIEHTFYFYFYQVEIQLHHNVSTCRACILAMFPRHKQIHERYVHVMVHLYIIILILYPLCTWGLGQITRATGNTDHSNTAASSHKSTWPGHGNKPVGQRRWGVGVGADHQGHWNTDHGNTALYHTEDRGLTITQQQH